MAFLRETHGLKHESVSMLFPDAPFRDSKLIDNAVDILKIFDTDTVIGVRQRQICFTHDGNGMTPIQSKPHLRLEAEEIYRKTGGLQVFRDPFKKLVASWGHSRSSSIGRASFVIRSELSWQIANSIATILGDKRELSVLKYESLIPSSGFKMVNDRLKADLDYYTDLNTNLIRDDLNLR